MVISRGGQGAKRSRRARARSTQAEVASVDGDLIVVEPFSTKHRVFVERGVT